MIHLTASDLQAIPYEKSSIPCMDEVGDCPVTNDVRIIKEIKELCQGLALSEKARALRYDKIVEVLMNEERGT